MNALRLTPKWGTRNQTDGGFCGHCTNTGWLILDEKDGEGEWGAPCPMCEVGASVDAAQYGGTYWQRYADLASASWRRGLTFRHERRCRFQRNETDRYPCGYPATDVYCAFHSDEQNRKYPPRWEVIRRALSAIANVRGAA